jgi:hypothetical protein
MTNNLGLSSGNIPIASEDYATLILASLCAKKKHLIKRSLGDVLEKDENGVTKVRTLSTCTHSIFKSMPRCPTTDEWIRKCGIYTQWNFMQP